MSLEQKINYQLNKYPGVKKVVKSVYQHAMYAVSPKIKNEGSIVRISPNDPSHEYFFGYYDKSPWDANDRYMLCMRAKDTWSDVSPKEKADIILIDTSLPEDDKKRVRKIAETSSWNVQQSCMLQWLGPDFSSRILFNDYRDGKYVAVIKEIESGAERIVPAPVYSVSVDGKIALTLDFSRLYNLRPGYGYYNVPEKTKGIALPDSTAVWKIDLESGTVTDLLTYKDFATFQPRPEMQEAGVVHKVNHLMLSPNVQRFMVLYRWFVGARKYTRLITCNIDGSDMYVLSDDDMVSHCFWKNDEHILAFENKKDGGPGYYLMKDKTQEYKHCWPELTGDGHPSYSPDFSHIVTDSYPDRARIQYIRVMNDEDSKPEVVAKVFSPFKYDNDTRCDLHPRWNHAGDKVCFDSVFEGHRGLYTVDVPQRAGIADFSKKISVIIPVYNVEKYLEHCVESVMKQTYKNIEVILVNDGSTDGSLAVAEKLQKKYPQIIIVDKENGGLSSARNAGLENASGEYVSFVDSDDWIKDDIYQRCIETFYTTECDVVDFKPAFVTDEQCDISEKNDSGMVVVEGEDILYDYLYRGQMEQSPFTVWRKVYKRDLFNKIEFPEGKINEDIATNFKVLRRTKRLVHIPYVGYFYYQGNDGSITSGNLRKRDFDLLDACTELCELAEKCSDKRIKNLAEIKLARSYFSLLAKAAVGGIAEDVNEKDLAFLKRNLRENYGVLMKSEMPLNRKMLVSMACLDYRIISTPYHAVQIVRGVFARRTNKHNCSNIQC